MRITGPIAASALVFTGLIITGSAAHSTGRTNVPQGVLAAAMSPTDQPNSDDQSVTVLPTEPLHLQSDTPQGDPGALQVPVPIHNVSLPSVPTRGIPEIALAAYRNAELQLQASMPNCGMSWHLLAGIGKVESNHAGNGRTEPDGTTRGVIYGPALDGTLPGNETIKAADGNFVRAVGPMQFLPGTWALYASDGNGDRKSDPNNIFDAVLGAGKYLCSGGLDMRDPKQESRAVLRYNNSLDYASQVLSWSNAYNTGGTPAQGELAPVPDSTPDGGIPDGAGSSMSAGETAVIADPTDPATPTDTPAPDTTTDPAPTTDPSTTTDPQSPSARLELRIQVMINIPGRDPIPCGIFCPSPKVELPTIPQTVTPVPTPLPTTTDPIPTTVLPTTTDPIPTTQTPTTTTQPGSTTPPAPTTSQVTPSPTTSTQPIAPAPAIVEQQTPQTPTTTTAPTSVVPTTTTTPKPPAPATPDRTPPVQPNSQQPAAPASTTPAPKQQPVAPTPTTPAPKQQPAAPAPAAPAPKQEPGTPAPVAPAPKQEPAAPAPSKNPLRQLPPRPNSNRWRQLQPPLRPNSNRQHQFRLPPHPSRSRPPPPPRLLNSSPSPRLTLRPRPRNQYNHP